ncbi:hypothetical protein FSP39_023105 [Pinctada imbricata]|uniref:Ig-like domain-containing protein n=1 Tax=Pinctada imbricata TaxID=66713 RepID=A0AA88YWM5_PINIB|nr:hypothetical protein FSP39_023105 [Pinctada imbricata]
MISNVIIYNSPDDDLRPCGHAYPLIKEHGIKWRSTHQISLTSVNSHIKDDELMSKNEVVGTLGDKVTMPCEYKSTNMWYIIQWQKEVNGSDPVTIVTLPRSFSTEDPQVGAQWNKDLNPDFRNRLGTHIEYNEKGVKFHLEFYSFTCDDTGVYTCILTGNTQMMAATKLGIQAPPSRPAIHNDLFIVDQENNTLTLECEASVGLPPATLKWYQHFPDGRGFLSVDNNEREQEIDISDKCKPLAMSRLDVTVTRPISGSVFRCVVHSPLLEEDTSLYDEVKVKIQVSSPDGSSSIASSSFIIVTALCLLKYSIWLFV